MNANNTQGNISKMISVIIVNYYSFKFTRKAVEFVLQSKNDYIDYGSRNTSLFLYSLRIKEAIPF